MEERVFRSGMFLDVGKGYFERMMDSGIGRQIDPLCGHGLAVKVC